MQVSSKPRFLMSVMIIQKKGLLLLSPHLFVQTINFGFKRLWFPCGGIPLRGSSVEVEKQCCERHDTYIEKIQAGSSILFSKKQSKPYYITIIAYNFPTVEIYQKTTAGQTIAFNLRIFQTVFFCYQLQFSSGWKHSCWVETNAISLQRRRLYKV